MSRPDDRERYLRPAVSLDADHPAVIAFAAEHTAGLTTDRERAVSLYYAVRDGFRYDPYSLDPRPEGFRASTVITSGVGYCVPKATLLAAACRAAGIPTRVGYADVRNHMTSPRLLEMMGTDEFVFHGYAELWLDGRWVKATPAFNLTLCERAGTRPLEFDGHADSLFHPLDLEGRRHMEYLRDHGTWDDVPVATILDAWRVAYPGSERWSPETLRGPRFESEVSAAS